jgi:hypothetical protein
MGRLPQVLQPWREAPGAHREAAQGEEINNANCLAVH